MFAIKNPLGRQPFLLVIPSNQHHVQVYAGYLEHTDTQDGKVIEELERQGPAVFRTRKVVAGDRVCCFAKDLFFFGDIEDTWFQHHYFFQASYFAR